MNLLKNQQAAELVDSSYIDLESMLMQNIVPAPKRVSAAYRLHTMATAETGRDWKAE